MNLATSTGTTPASVSCSRSSDHLWRSTRNQSGIIRAHDGGTVKSALAEPNSQRTTPGEEHLTTPGVRHHVLRLTLIIAVLVLTLLAAVIRLQGLAGPDGSLGKDEARLALAADGVLRTGLPMMPSGRVYTRGLFNSYLIAPSFAIFGRHDFAARLPSALAGALLVPIVFLLARGLGGTVAGLVAASFTAVAEPLLSASRSAWLPSVFLFLFLLTAYCCQKGFGERRAGWQIAGALCFWLALLSYEFAVLLVGALVVYLGLRTARGDRGWFLGRPTLLALGLMLAGMLAFGVLAIALRAGTLAGPLGEVALFFAPRARLFGAGYYLRELLGNYYLLLAAAVLPLLPPLARARPTTAGYLAGLLALAFLVPSFLVQSQYSPRYALPIVPLVAILAAASLARLLRLASDRLRLKGPARSLVSSAGLLVVFSIALQRDVAAAAHLPQPILTGPTWVDELDQQGLEPDDLIVAEIPAIARFYLGRAEYYVDSEDYERYAYRAPDAIRSIYTDSVLLYRRGDFERLVEQPNSGRRIWLIGRGERLLGLAYQVGKIDRSLWSSLLRSADLTLQTSDGWIVLRVPLPRRDS